MQQLANKLTNKTKRRSDIWTHQQYIEAEVKDWFEKKQIYSKKTVLTLLR